LGKGMTSMLYLDSFSFTRVVGFVYITLLRRYRKNS
jgi:hypothetical protein